MGLKEKLAAAQERANAGRQAKLGAKSDIANKQGNLKKGAALDMRSKKVALRSEKRQAIVDAKNLMKGKNLLGKAPETDTNYQNPYSNEKAKAGKSLSDTSLGYGKKTLVEHKKEGMKKNNFTFNTAKAKSYKAPK